MKLTKYLQAVVFFATYTLFGQVDIPYYQNFERENFWEDVNTIGAEVATAELPRGTDLQETYCRTDSNASYARTPLTATQQCYLRIVEEAKNYSWELSNTHAINSARKALKLTVHENDIPRMGAHANSRTRSEIVFITPSDRKLYYKWELFIPNDHEFIEEEVEASYHRLFQLKPQSRDPKTGEKYDISANTIAALDYIYEPHADATDLHRDLYFYVDPPSIVKEVQEGRLESKEISAHRKRLRIKDGLIKGSWNTIVIKINPSYRSNGYMQLWLNHKPVVFTKQHCSDLSYEAIVDTDTKKDASKFFGENVVQTNDINPKRVGYGVKLGHYRQYLTRTMSMYINSFSATEYYPVLRNEIETQLIAKYCEKKLDIADLKLECSPVENATAYRFHFMAEDGSEFSIDSSSPQIDIREDQRFYSNKSYGVKVKAIGAEFDYGSTCYIRTPATTRVVDTDCNKHRYQIGEELRCYRLQRGTKYIFRFTREDDSQQKWIHTTDHKITIPEDPYFKNGMRYKVEVREDKTDYGKSCTIEVQRLNTTARQENGVAKRPDKKQITAQKQAGIYPNPFFDSIILPALTEKRVKVTITNLKNEVVYNREIPSVERTLAVSFIPKGIYLIRIKGKHTNITETLIKE